MIVEPSEDGALARSANRLASETSPYLLQHALNPVAWFPWGDEAFRRARDEDKPIFLSIGYSTCHWCHVMAHESFEDTEVACLMNDAFVSVKVDREERADVDHVYMMACQMVTGSGGWPLTIIMTPDGKPFFAATYIPKENRFGRVGMLDLIPRIKDLWVNQRSRVLSIAEEITSALRRSSEANPEAERRDPGLVPPDAEPDKDRYRALLDAAYTGLAETFDRKHGGFGGAPKFPMPHNLTFLLRHWKRTGREDALAMVRRTLDEMRAGGIYDHIGFGFHRYSTDQLWLVPHFEKMLYDQALLAIAYTEAFQATGSPEYRATAEETIAYVLRDMTSQEGGFHSAEDADSEGAEGKFYLWTVREVREALAKDDADLAVRLFSLAEEGNAADHATDLPRGANIIHVGRPLRQVAKDLDVSPSVLAQRLDKIRQTLLAKRSERVRPQKDDKILADWNGLMIAALAKASQAVGNPDYAAEGARAADFVLGKMRSPEGRLLHSWRDGRAGCGANLDDYAFMVWGLVELYGATFKVLYLEAALELARTMITHFWDDSAGGFYFTPDDGEVLLLRHKLVHDGALPSGNSVALLGLARLARMTGDAALETTARLHARWLHGVARHAPLACVQSLVGLDFLVGPSLLPGGQESGPIKA